MALSGQDLADLRALADRSRGLLEELRTKAGEEAQRRGEELERLGGDATQLIEQLSAQIANELAQDLADGQTKAERATWEQEKEQWNSVRDQVETELAAKEQRLAEKEQRLKEEAERLASATTTEGGNTSGEDFEALQSERDEYAAALEEANVRLGNAQAIETQNTELSEKLERVLQDLGEHREHVARLEEQLAERPESSEADGAELTRLREERDELTRRLEEALNAAPAGEGAEELADLTRRFEMAVEDVRELKNENAGLKERLAAGPTTSTAPVDEGGGSDWEAQKRRLLASLEGEGEPDAQNDPQRVEERVTIEGTIQITDGVVAEKEQEIERLRGELAAAEEASKGSAHDEATTALIDNDAVVQAERQRLAELEKEFEEKLRQVELELSVERAKISRAQSKVEEQQLELETLRELAAGEAGSGQAAGDAKRRWLEKLGLGGAESGDES